jgi:hypothetical protein
MTKSEAIAVICTAYEAERASNSRAKKILRACKVLGIDDTWRVFAMCGYARHDTFEPYSQAGIVRIWPLPS